MSVKYKSTDNSDRNADCNLLDNFYSSNNKKMPRYIYVLTILSAIGGFLFGYDTGVVSGAMLLIRDEFSLTNAWHEAIVSATVGAAWIFALVGGVLADKLGRKPVIIIASVTFTVGAVVMGVANSKVTLLIGRLIVGIGIGFASMSVPLYIAEASAPEIRGTLVTTNNIFITGGQFTAALICGGFSDVYGGWRYMVGLAGIPSFIQLVGFMFMPESPRWLVSKGKLKEARKVLADIRGEGFPIDEELESIKYTCDENDREVEEIHGSKSTLLRILKHPATRRALVLGCLLQMFQQLSGINTVMYYSASIIQMAGVHNTTLAIWLASTTAAANFIFTFIGLYLVERVGRRTLTLGSLAGVVVTLAFLGVSFHLGAINAPLVTVRLPGISNLCTAASSCATCTEMSDCGFCYYQFNSTLAVNGSCLKVATEHFDLISAYGPCVNATGGNPTSSGITWAWGWCPWNYSWITIVGLVLYLFFFAPGMGPMPWTINAEIYPLWARSTCTSIATSTNWMFNLLVSMTFLTLTSAVTPYGAFYIYSGVATIGFIIFILVLPETRGRSLEEMEFVFSQSWFHFRGDSIKPGSTIHFGSSDSLRDEKLKTSAPRFRNVEKNISKETNHTSEL